MSDDLSSSVKALREIAPRLNKATDAAAEVINSANEFLASLSIGVTAVTQPFWVDSGLDAPADGEAPLLQEVTRSLAYGRNFGGFTIHVAEITLQSETGRREDGVMVGTDAIPWNSLPREQKLKSVSMLPSLIDGILANATGLASEAEAAVELVTKMMASLKADPSDTGSGKGGTGGTGSATSKAKPETTPTAADGAKPVSRRSRAKAATAPADRPSSRRPAN